MKIEFTVSGKRYVVSCGNVQGTTVNKWNGIRKQFWITVCIDDGEPVRFIYYDCIANYPKPLDESGLRLAFECYVSDASCVAWCDGLDDFMRELSYKDRSEARRAYEACSRANDFFKRSGVDLYELQVWLEENE